MINMTKKRFSVTIDEAEYNRLEKFRKSVGATRSSVIETLIKEYLDDWTRALDEIVERVLKEQEEELS